MLIIYLLMKELELNNHNYQESGQQKWQCLKILKLNNFLILISKNQFQNQLLK